jgi:hypothetical protein
LTAPDETLQIDGVDEVTDVEPSPVVLTIGTKLPPTAAVLGEGMFPIVGWEGVPGPTRKLC